MNRNLRCGGTDGARTLRHTTDDRARRKHFWLVSRSLSDACGGAKRVREVVAFLGNEGGYSVRILSTEAAPEFRALPARVTLLGARGAGFLARWRFVFSVAARLFFGKRPHILWLDAPFLEAGFLTRMARALGVKAVLHLTLAGQDGPADLIQHRRYPSVIVKYLAEGLASADLVLATGAGMLAGAADAGWPAQRMRLIPTPKDETLFRPPRNDEEKRSCRRALGLQEDALLVGFIGNLVPRKGIAELREAWQAVCREIEGTELVIAGGTVNGSATWAEKQMALFEGVPHRWLGRLPHAKIPDVLRALDVFILPSTAEGFPNVLAEAMMTGLPCVINRYRGFSQEFIQDGMDALVVDCGANGELAAALRQLLHDPGLRQRLGARALERSAVFHRSRVFPELLRALDTLCAET